MQYQGHNQHQRRRHEVHAAPTRQVGHCARNEARQQYAQYHTTGHGANHLAALLGAGQGGNISHHHLDHDRHQPDQHHRAEQHAPAWREAHCAQGHGRQQQLRKDEFLAIKQVTQRHHQQQPHGVTGLSRGDYHAYGTGRNRQAERYGLQ
ncbi:hypothetical protein D3C77_239030 [compost metagenome]